MNDAITWRVTRFPHKQPTKYLSVMCECGANWDFHEDYMEYKTREKKLITWNDLSYEEILDIWGHRDAPNDEDLKFIGKLFRALKEKNDEYLSIFEKGDTDE
jgi:hypothetical protein